MAGIRRTDGTQATMRSQEGRDINRIYRSMFACGGIVFVLAASAQGPSQVAAKGPTPIRSPRPVEKAVELLQHLYGKVVTYEEPVLTWSGELQPQAGRDPSLKWALTPIPRTFTMPAETGIDSDLSRVLDRTLAAYHRQTNGTRFKIQQSDWGYHIVPDLVHDDTGQFIAAHSALDSVIHVPVEARTAYEHYRAVLKAVSAASGTLVNSGVAGSPRGFNSLFRANPPEFRWGADGVVAREALIDLLKHSATTMLWHLLCQASAKPADRFCVLNLSLLEVTASDAQGNRINQALRFDRCRDCTGLPGAAPRATGLPNQ